MEKKLINSQLVNMATYLMYRRQMLTLAENVFSFENLPSFIDLAYLNKTLVYNGMIAFFKDEELGVIALPFSIIGSLDIYGRPREIMARAFNGRYFRRLKEGEFIIMYDNTGMFPIYIDILQRAERIALIKRTQDININQQKTPRIWKTNKNKEKSVKRIINQIDGLEENIAVYDSLDIEDLTAELAPVPYVTDKLDEHLNKEWAEFLEFIGIADSQVRKKERVLMNEITTSMGGTIASRFSRFEPRQKAVNSINEKWDLNIKVKYYDGNPTSEKEDDKDVFLEFSDGNISDTNISTSTT